MTTCTKCARRNTTLFLLLSPPLLPLSLCLPTLPLPLLFSLPLPPPPFPFAHHPLAPPTTHHLPTPNPQPLLPLSPSPLVLHTNTRGNQWWEKQAALCFGPPPRRTAVIVGDTEQFGHVLYLYARERQADVWLRRICGSVAASVEPSPVTCVGAVCCFVVRSCVGGQSRFCGSGRWRVCRRCGFAALALVAPFLLLCSWLLLSVTLRIMLSTSLEEVFNCDAVMRMGHKFRLAHCQKRTLSAHCVQEGRALVPQCEERAGSAHCRLSFVALLLRLL